MTTAPILRSSALQKSLALPPVKRTTSPTSFASTLAQAKATAVSKKPTPMATPLKSSLPGSADVPFQDLLVAAAKKYGIDPALLAGVVKQESNFNPNARSGVGAKGLTQLIDATARGLGVSDSFDPAQSLEGGAKFLSGLLKQFKGDESLALAAYNAGPGAVQKYGGIPPYEETQRYVPKVLGYTAQFRRIWADSTPAPYMQTP
jgi:soluble lytic murein transglycosylase-like protein